MTTTDNFVCFEEVTISKTRKETLYKVNLELEGYIFYIDKEIVDNIISQTHEDENLIAILLAYIEYSRKSRNTHNRGRAKCLDKKLLVDGISKLLVSYSSERLIKLVRNLKWHEIDYVFNSDNPIEKMDEVI